MKKILLLFVILLIYGCNKPKTVLICGDHVCINKAEAQQYFEDNLTLEVQVINKKRSKEIDLVELNLKTNSDGKKEIAILNKDKTNENLKILSNKEIERKKAELKKRKKTKKEKNEKIKKQKEVKLVKLKEKKIEKKNIKIKNQNNALKKKKNANKPYQEIVDVCTILEKCTIDEISQYLIKKGKEEKFPNITKRE